MTANMPKHRGDPRVHPAHVNSWPGAIIRAVTLALLLSFSSIAVVGAQESTPEATPSAEPTPSPSMPRLELDLEQLNDSGISGTVTLYDAGDQTIVEFAIDNVGGGHPAHIHEGVCGDLNPEPSFNLDNVDEAGESTTVVDASLDDLLAEDYAIDVHLAPDELGTLIACADIDGEPELPDDATPEASPESTPSDGTGGTTQTPVATADSDGTGGAIPTATAQATETEIAVQETTPEPTPTEVVSTPEPTPTTTPEPAATSGQGDISDGTGGAISAVPLPTQSTTSPGDGTAGVSGKGDPVPANTLPQQAGVGAALIWPANPMVTITWASAIAAVVLGGSAWIIRRGERATLTTPSRWTRLGI